MGSWREVQFVDKQTNLKKYLVSCGLTLHTQVVKPVLIKLFSLKPFGGHMICTAGNSY